MLWQMRRLLPSPALSALCLVFAVMVSGCRRSAKGSAASTSPEASAAVAPATPGAPAPHPGEAADPAAVKAAFDQFKVKMQRPPNYWEELIDAKLLSAVPKRKDGQPLNFNEYIEFTEFRSRPPGK